MINVLGSSIEEVYPGTFGQVRNGRLDIGGTIWNIFLRHYEQNASSRSTARGLFRHGDSFASWLKTYLDHGYQIPPLPIRLECWILLVGKFRNDNHTPVSVFLLWRKLIGGSRGDKTYRRIGLVIGLVQYNESGYELTGPLSIVE